MSKWVPLHAHSMGSLLDGLSKHKDIANRCESLGYNAFAITDHGTISEVVALEKAFKDKKIKLIRGCEFYLPHQDSTIKMKENRSLSHLCVLAKNLDGWKSLIKAVSASNARENFYHRPRLDLDKFANYAGNLITFSGHMGSELANILFTEPKLAYNATTYDEAKALIDPDWIKKTSDLASKYQEIFGKGNFFIEIQRIDREALPAQDVVTDGLRYIAKKLGIPCVATADSHYCKPEDADDQRVLLCTAMETTLSSVKKRLDQNEDVGLGGFFKSRQYHIPTEAEMEALHRPEELANSLLIADMCEDYKITGKPMLPEFPGVQDQMAKLRELCREGWRSKIANRIPKDQQQRYSDQVKHELEILGNAGLAGYFLIVQDYVNHFRQKGYMALARGSGAGCLVSHLVGISDMVDPIEYNLIFERFYNAGRNTPDRVQFPDIDMDFPVTKRDQVIKYMKDKYGSNRVAQICTFGKMMGRGALKDVLRVHEACSFEEMNKVTEYIPDEAEISDQLQIMQEEEGESSIVKWALENNSKHLEEWCVLKDDGSLEGRFSNYFAQAIRLEGTKRSQGKHAAGVVISSEDLSDVCPMVPEKHGDAMVCGMDMYALETMGHIKFDILGVAALDKIMGIQGLLRNGRIE